MSTSFCNTHKSYNQSFNMVSKNTQSEEPNKSHNQTPTRSQNEHTQDSNPNNGRGQEFLTVMLPIESSSSSNIVHRPRHSLEQDMLSVMMQNEAFRVWLEFLTNLSNMGVHATDEALRELSADDLIEGDLDEVDEDLLDEILDEYDTE